VITFTAQDAPEANYTWLFGDGTLLTGRVVKHQFTDALGTELDGAATGAGRFRVLLHVKLNSAYEDWASQGIAVVGKWHDAQKAAGAKPGLGWKIYAADSPALLDLTKQQATLSGTSAGIQVSGQTPVQYTAAWDGFLNIPEDGGYSFHLIDADGARLVIDGVQVAKTGSPFPQVCGATGNALRYDRGAIGLRQGKHSIHIEGLHTISEGTPKILWEGPGVKISAIPDSAYLHIEAATAVSAPAVTK
jgi:hypothetical protein